MANDYNCIFWYVVAGYMEEKRLSVTLEYLARLKSRLNEKKLEIIPVLIDDGSTDSTYKIMSEFVNRFKGFTARIKHRGRGAALQEGIRIVHNFEGISNKEEIIVFSSADLKLPLNDFIETHRLIFEEDRDGVFLSKNLPGSLMRRSFLRKFLSLSFNQAVRFLFNLPYKDTQGVKFIKFTEKTFKILENCTEQGFIYDTEVAVQLNMNEMKIIEVPFHIKTSIEKGSKVNFYSAILMGISLVDLLIKIRFRRKYLSNQFED